MKYVFLQILDRILNNDVITSIKLKKNYYYLEVYVENSLAGKCYKKRKNFQIVEKPQLSNQESLFLIKELE